MKENEVQAAEAETADPGLIAAIISLLDRDIYVREWPEDEKELHRGWKGSFESRHQAVLEFRAKKIISLVQSAQ